MLGFTAVLAFIAKSLRLVKLMRELRDRILQRNRLKFALIFTFFHGFPLIIEPSLYNTIQRINIAFFRVNNACEIQKRF